MKRKFIFLSYRLLLAFVLPVILLYLLFRIARDRRYGSGASERWGSLPVTYQRTGYGSIWLHAVSVGEVLSSVELIKQLQEADPQRPLYLSTATLAGRKVARDRLAPLGVRVFYAPFDYVFVIRRVLRQLKPSMVLVLETEIWPNLYREVTRTGASLLIINGRISERALSHYQRWRWFFSEVLRLPDAILTQTRCDGTHYRALGAPPERLHAAGNLKYDLTLGANTIPEDLQRFFKSQSGRAIWIAASTTAKVSASERDEEDAVISAFLRLNDCLLVLVPRKPERFNEAAQKLAAAGIQFVRRTALNGKSERVDALLLDSIGELNALFPLADVVFMGGTLTARGGHNILEPASARKPVIAGPHMENFEEIANQFDTAQAWIRVQNCQELGRTVQRVLSDPSLAAQLGEKAWQAAQAQRGVTARIREVAEFWYDTAVPHPPPYGPVTPLLWLLSKVWELGANMRRCGVPGKLSAPVISIGNLSTGGAGKTPLVRHLAGWAHRSGFRAAVLTRGYRRKSRQRHLIFPPGAPAEAFQTGDEAQLYLRDGFAAVGIGRDRFETGVYLEKEAKPQIIFLDDAFQHARIHRDLDVVLIDALNPFAGGHTVPLGGLREPLSALARADLFLITRATQRRSYRGIRSELARWNPGAPVLTSSVHPLGWIQMGTGVSRTELPTGEYAAFCGLANPNSFWQTLDQLGVPATARTAFRDHHRYSLRELAEISGNGRFALLTTEKDAINLPEGFNGTIWYLRIVLGIEEQAVLLDRIKKLMH